jgi:glycosyltransferase involved in cell wall biosynthesis
LHLLERQCLRRTGLVTAFSEFTRRRIRRLHGPAIAGGVRVIPGWADLERFRIVSDRAAARAQLEWPVDVPVLFTVRRLVPRMGLDRLIQAMPRIGADGRPCLLVIAGEGPLRGALQGLARNLHLESSVQFSGRVDETTLSTMYGAADAFVLPTRALECFGLIAIEALASGVPVLATPTGAIPEILNAGWPATRAPRLSRTSHRASSTGGCRSTSQRSFARTSSNVLPESTAWQSWPMRPWVRRRRFREDRPQPAARAT